jgi:hypothetical protein
MNLNRSVKVSLGDTSNSFEPAEAFTEVVVDEVAVVASFENTKLQKFVMFTVELSSFFSCASPRIELSGEHDGRRHLLDQSIAGCVGEDKRVVLDSLVVIEPELLEDFAGWALSLFNLTEVRLVFLPEHVVHHREHRHVELKQVALVVLSEKDSTSCSDPATTTFSESTD